MAINGKIAINGKMAINGQNGRILYARYDSNNILSQNRTFWEKGNYIGNLCFCCNFSITMKMKKNKMAQRLQMLLNQKNYRDIKDRGHLKDSVGTIRFAKFEFSIFDAILNLALSNFNRPKCDYASPLKHHLRKVYAKFEQNLQWNFPARAQKKFHLSNLYTYTIHTHSRS